MLLYVVVTFVFFGPVTADNIPIMVYRGTTMYSDTDCKRAAEITLQAARKAVRKAKLPLSVETTCTRAGYEV